MLPMTPLKNATERRVKKKKLCLTFVKNKRRLIRGISESTI